MKSRFIPVLLLGIATATLGPLACKQGEEPTGEVAPGTEAGILLASMDTSVDPGDDFYSYANGKWMETTEIPADRSNVGGFWIADQQTERNLQALIAEPEESEPQASS